MLQLLKQLQGLQAANGEQQMEDGFQVGETVLTVTGQPEFAAGLKLLEGVLGFMGVFGSSSSSSSPAQTQALSTLTKNLQNVNTQVQYLQAESDALNKQLAGVVNQAQISALLDMQSALTTFQNQLYPNSHVLNPSGSGLGTQAASAALHQGSAGASGSAGPAAEPVDRATAGTIASGIQNKLDLFIANEPQYFIGDDIKTIPAVYAPKDPTAPNGTPPKLISPKQVLAWPGLKPNPGLTIYVHGLQLWITAMEIESAGTASGHAGIKQNAQVQAWLKKHVAFLQSKINAGADPNTPSQTACSQMGAAGLQSMPATNPGACFGTIQDRIIGAVSCQWSVHGGPGGSSYPDKQGTCSATLSCRDSIAHNYPKIPPVSIAWKQQDQNSFCMLDPNGQLLSSGVGLNGRPLTSPMPFPKDIARQVENALQQQYGLMAMDRMAGMLEQVALTGSAIGYGSTAPSCNGCNFGTKGDAPFFVYAVDGSGAVKNYAGFRNQPLPQAAAAGTIANIQALIPGGDKTFYAITKDGKLNWYQFTPARQSAGAQPAANTVIGPVTVASGFNAYKQVFGGSDGVIYAVQNDGTLLWFRHAGFANGGGAATMTGPKPVASGFGQFKNVFSAGSGIIYGVAADGSLLWYRHKNYLTGVADAANAKNTASANNTANAKNTVSKVNMENLTGPTQLEGPVTVGSGWGNFRQIVPSGAGVVLAVQSDGTLLWYRHDDYLTGVSTGSGATAPGAGTSVQKGAASAERDLSSGSKTLASSWGTPVQAGGINSGSPPSQHPATGTPQWGTQPQVRPVAGTAGAPSSLHGTSEAMQTLHAGQPSNGGGAAPGIGARQNVGATSAFAATLGTPHWEGPATVTAHSGWEGFAAIAAVLPDTVQTNVIK